MHFSRLCIDTLHIYNEDKSDNIYFLSRLQIVIHYH